MKRFFQGGSKEPFLKSVRVIVAHYKGNLAGWIIHASEKTLLNWMFGSFRFRRFAANRASNAVTRWYAARQLRNALKAMRKADPSIRFRHLTIVHNGWRTSDRETTVDLEAVKRTISQLMFNSGLDGWVGIVEVQAESLATRGYGRDLMPHGHLIIWSRDPAFDFGNLEKKLKASARLECPPGAHSALITGNDDTPPHVLKTWTWYIFKLPAFAKNPVPSETDPEKKRYLGADIRPNLAVRLMEVLSMMNFDELIMGSGEGNPIAVQLRKDIRQYTRKGDAECHESDIARFWKKARKRSRKDAYRPVVITRWKSKTRTAPYVRGAYRKRSEEPISGD